MLLRRNQPDWVRASSPSYNRPLVPRVEALARGLRKAAAQIATQVTLPFEDLYRPSRSGLGFTVTGRDLPMRSAWALIGEWLVAAAVQSPSASQGIAATHEWFWRGSARKVGEVPDVAEPIRNADPVQLRALLPYLLDPMAPATRRDVLSARSTADERRSRKNSGVYYTPGDVAYLMVEDLLRARDSLDTHLWFDPAHGSGVFLRAAFCALGGEAGVADRLYGVDLDPIAAETASFVLTAEDLIHNPDATAPWERWHRFRRNLATGDALMIKAPRSQQDPGTRNDLQSHPIDGHPLGRFEPWQLQSVFPETANRGFGRVIANPPYAPLQRGAASLHAPDLHSVTGPSSTADISPIFLELCTNVLSEGGSLAVVLPLSVVSSTRSPFPELRQYLVSEPGRLELLSFDRAPDALFGDDIKTRNAIVHLDRSAPDSLVASPLHRWTSRTRETALSRIPTTFVDGIPGVPNVIPKIGSEWERELLLACKTSDRLLVEWCTRRRQSSLDSLVEPLGDKAMDLLALAPTAYNFLSVLRDPIRALTDGHDSKSKYSVLSLRSNEHASAAYALLSSRLAFWLWHVTGDGFHVTRRLLLLLPVPLETGVQVERLAKLGDRLWKDAVQSPIASKNRGRTTVAYPGWPHTELIDEIDAEVSQFIGVDYRAQLTRWYEKLTTVDRETAIRRNFTGRK